MRLGVAVTLAVVVGCIHPLQAEEPTNHAVNPSELLVAVSQADKVVVFDGSPAIHEDDRQAPQPILYSSDRAEDIRELGDAVSVKPPNEWFMCACLPIVDVALFRDGKKIGLISIYEGIAVGFNDWDGNAWPMNQQRLLRWFDRRGVTGPRRAVDLQREQEATSAKASEKWSKAIPESLRPTWKKALEAEEKKFTIGSSHDALEAAADVMQPAFEAEFPDRNTRIGALFSWFGSGAGPWSGYPMYEDVAARLLLRYQFAELLAALQQTRLTTAQLEGAARFFAGYDYGWLFKEPNDFRLIDQLPNDLKRALLDHVLKSADHDKVDRARHAFEHHS